MKADLLGTAAALGSAASWAVGAILFKNLGENIPALAMTLGKGILSTLMLGLVLLPLGFNHLTGSDFFYLALSGLIGISVGDSLFFKALQHIGAHLLVLLFMVGQILTALLAMVFLHEMPTAAVWTGIVLIATGVGVILWSKLTEDGPPTNVRGIILGLLSVLCMSGSVIIAKKGLGTDDSGIQATFVRMGTACVGMAIYGAFTAQLGTWAVAFRDVKLAGKFLAAVAVITFGGFWLSLYAIKQMDVAIANTLISTEPIFVLPLAAIFLKEKITAASILGATVALAGVGVICLY
jgi:drug/metabolite transporter (DMT)-like permease